ncbi:hypothetical protein LWI29_007002 [Acer saccharum]|uniref:Zinc finger ZPR1-type domain-containing protein n=1 Tax=Acer saccharum TaxID=4024 RepID=A0AA39S4K0_ACESA|nr:hypothetical protein LWI29_007002 [Acer saccharum]
MEMGNKNTEQMVDVGSVVEAVSTEDSDAPLYKVERRKWHNNILDDFDSALPKDELQALQEERKKVDLQTTEACAKGDSPFTLILDDPAGNDFIENLYAPSPDPSLSIKFYEQHALLGYLVDPSQSTEEAISASDQMKRKPHGSVGAAAGHRAIAQSNSAEIAEALFRHSAPEEVMIFPSTFGTCSAYCETGMFVTRIPYFQEVIFMAFTCNACSYSNSELKPDSASVEVPELDLELAVVTTVEGLITKISESLERVHGFTFGDSLEDSKRNKWLDFKARLNKLPSLEESWTLILHNELADSFIAPVIDDI